MKFRQCFALTFLSLLCMEYVHGGALLKDFTKGKNKTEDSKNDKNSDDALVRELKSGEKVDDSMTPETSEDDKPESDEKAGASITPEASDDDKLGSGEKLGDSITPEASGQDDVKDARTDKDTESSKFTDEKVDKKKIVGDPVVLKIGEVDFKRSQILADLRLIPPQLVKGVPADKLFGMLVDQKMSTYLMVEQAKKAGMDRTKDFREKIERMKEELLARTFLIKEISPKADNKSTLKARYTKYLVEFKKGKEHQVWHIMVATEDEAQKIIEALKKKADFMKLAKEKSIAPSKENSGDEGYIPLNLLPASISDKLLALKNGEYTTEAIKTDGGFHIFKIGDSRDTSPQKFEEIKDTLKQMILQEEVMKMIERLEKQYSVEKFNEDGSAIVKTNIKK